MRAGVDGLSFSPSLPPGLAGLSFRMRYQGRIVRVAVRRGAASYELLHGDPLPIKHHGQPVTVGPDEVTLDIPAVTPPPPPSQPQGRLPQQRHARGDSGT
jgi:alpha,alpha-trehalose phosphorylase